MNNPRRRPIFRGKSDTIQISGLRIRGQRVEQTLLFLDFSLFRFSVRPEVQTLSDRDAPFHGCGEHAILRMHWLIVEEAKALYKQA